MLHAISNYFFKLKDNGGSASGIVVQANDTTIIDGWDCFVLTPEQVTTIYNTLVAGKSVTVTSEDGKVQYNVYMGDATTDRPSIVIPYYWYGWVDYQITPNDEVAITIHKIPEEPTHKITSVSIGTDTIDLTIS